MAQFINRNEGDGENGPLGIKSIVSWLNNRGYRARKGKPFYTSFVHRALRDEIYAGRHCTHKKTAKNRKAVPKEKPGRFPSGWTVTCPGRRAANWPACFRQHTRTRNSCGSSNRATLTTPFSIPPGSRESTTWRMFFGDNGITRWTLNGNDSRLEREAPDHQRHSHG